MRIPAKALIARLFAAMNLAPEVVILLDTYTFMPLDASAAKEIF